MSCQPATTSDGRTVQEPCGMGVCGPLDRSQWYDVAAREIERARAWAPSMDESQRAILQSLAAQYQALPSRMMLVPITDVHSATLQAARIAQDARELACRVAENRPRIPGDVPPTDPSTPDGSWFPSLPGLPKWPGFPSFNLPNIPPWLILVAILLLLGDDD